MDLIGGIHTPLEGAVALAPHLTVGVVPQSPLFLETASLLDNLRYGSEKTPESVIWSVCRALGVPRHLSNPKGGRMVMGSIGLTPHQRMLVAVARVLLCQPDVLVVHNLGALEPKAARRLGHVFSLYVEGCALTRLGRGSSALRRFEDVLDKSGLTLEPVPTDAATTHRPPGATCQLKSSQFCRRAAVQDPHLIRRAAVRLRRIRWMNVSDDDDVAMKDQAYRRTVVWHGYSNVLRGAGVERLLAYENGRLMRAPNEPELEDATILNPAATTTRPSINQQQRDQSVDSSVLHRTLTDISIGDQMGTNDRCASCLAPDVHTSTA